MTPKCYAFVFRLNRYIIEQFRRVPNSIEMQSKFGLKSIEGPNLRNGLLSMLQSTVHKTTYARRSPSVSASNDSGWPGECTNLFSMPETLQ